MVQVDISTAVCIYLFLNVVGLLVLWFLSEMNRVFYPQSGRNYFWQCSICMFTYIDSRHEVISVCPHCGSYNKREGEG
jgi:hypothetical protein